jgi:hypothetical protein
MTPKFCRLANLASFSTTPCAPWEDSPAVPPDPKTLENKTKYKKWLADPESVGYLYSAIEGLSPNQRLGKDNPPAMVHGLVIDYDSPFNEEQIEAWKTEGFPCPCPAYIHPSLSGNLRAIYTFENSIPVHNEEITTLFLKEAIQYLRLNKLAAGIDPASASWSLYQDRGPAPGRAIGGPPLPDVVVHTIMHRAGKKLKDWSTKSDPDIPLDVVWAEVQSKFPGRWAGGFAEGTRGVRFWDASADNPTAAVVRSSGMQTFTGGQGFVSWREILGSGFVKKWEEDSLGKISMNCAYDGKNFWHKDRTWNLETLEAFKRILRGTYNQSSAKPKEFSQLDSAMLYIQQNRRMDVIGPFIHYPPGPTKIDGFGRVLNTSQAVCMEPADEAGAWGERFPWLAGFFDTLFDDPIEQKDHFLAWFKWFYQNARLMAPQSGQATVFAGPVGCGKTFLSTGIVGTAVGGATEATEFLMGNTEFSTDVAASPVMAIDDATPGAEMKHHATYTAMVKKVTANQHLRYRRMRTDPVQVLWMGRTIITCNLDPQSMDLLPGLEQSNRDKVSLFLCKTPEVRFPSTREAHIALLHRELPHLLRWLLDWTPPDGLITGGRFGTKEFHHPKLVAAATERSASQTFIELLDAFIYEYKSQHHIEDLLKDEEARAALKPWTSGIRGLANQVVLHPELGICWHGTVASLAESMRDAPECRWVREFSLRQISGHLARIQTQGFKVAKSRRSSSQIWFIPLEQEIN